jgi:hypothetical protein
MKSDKEISMDQNLITLIAKLEALVDAITPYVNQKITEMKNASAPTTGATSKTPHEVEMSNLQYATFLAGMIEKYGADKVNKWKAGGFDPKDVQTTAK